MLLFALSITGIVIILNGHYPEFLNSGNINDITKTSTLKYHVLMALFLVLLLIIHVIGVLKHYVFTKENTLLINPGKGYLEINYFGPPTTIVILTIDNGEIQGEFKWEDNYLIQKK